MFFVANRVSSCMSVAGFDVVSEVILQEKV